jgi:hypothetical protein
MRLTPYLAAGLALAACSAVPAETPDQSGAQPSPAPVSPPAAERPEADQCKATDYQWLVGQPQSRIPQKPANANWRVVCTTCPVTMDHSPQRLNIFFDRRTKLVESVRCG